MLKGYQFGVRTEEQSKELEAEDGITRIREEDADSILWTETQEETARRMLRESFNEAKQEHQRGRKKPETR